MERDPIVTRLAAFVNRSGESCYSSDRVSPDTRDSAGVHFPRIARRFDLTVELSEWQDGWYTNTVYGDGLANKGHVLGDGVKMKDFVPAAGKPEDAQLQLYPRSAILVRHQLPGGKIVQDSRLLNVWIPGPGHLKSVLNPNILAGMMSKQQAAGISSISLGSAARGPNSPRVYGDKSVFCSCVTREAFAGEIEAFSEPNVA